MNKRNRNIGDEIIHSMKNAVKHMRGKKTQVITHKIKVPDNINVKDIRSKLKLSRSKFADRFGFSSRTLQHWEQGDRKPQGAARVLLLLLQKEPETIENILNPKIELLIKPHRIAAYKKNHHVHSTTKHKRK